MYMCVYIYIYIYNHWLVYIDNILNILINCMPVFVYKCFNEYLMHWVYLIDQLTSNKQFIKDDTLELCISMGVCLAEYQTIK